VYERTRTFRNDRDSIACVAIRARANGRADTDLGRVL
jgi:hypothetical protein